MPPVAEVDCQPASHREGSWFCPQPYYKGIRAGEKSRSSKGTEIAYFPVTVILTEILIEKQLGL